VKHRKNRAPAFGGTDIKFRPATASELEAFADGKLPEALYQESGPNLYIREFSGKHVMQF
jgi:hypothetical protein